MNKLFLTKPVMVTGLDYFGRKTWLTFEPNPEQKPGWWWDTGRTIVPIDINLATTELRRVVLRHEDRTFNVWEHPGILRYTGIDSVIVRCRHFNWPGMLGGGWPPYDGCAQLYWDALKEHLVESTDKVVWRHVTKSSKWNYPEKEERQTLIGPAKDETCTVYTMTDYAGVGSAYTKFVVGTDDVRDLFPVKSQGWPLWLYQPGRFLEKFSPIKLRPSQMTWPQTHGGRARELYNYHRVLDILGDFSLVFHDALPACVVESNCSGHLGDIMAIKKLFA